MYILFATYGLFEVAIESWLEWDLSPRPLSSAQTLRSCNRRSYQAMSSTPLRVNFVQALQFHRLFSVKFHFGYCLRQSPRNDPDNAITLFKVSPL